MEWSDSNKPNNFVDDKELKSESKLLQKNTATAHQ